MADANRTRTPHRSKLFWAKVDRGADDECWTWTGAKNKLGYGHFFVGKFNGKNKYAHAHRFAYEELIGEIPNGLVIDHLCRVPSCVNPKHLEPVTQRENLNRGETFNRRNALTSHCPKGHPLDEANTLTWTRGDGRVHRKCRECDRTRVRERYRREHALSPDQLRPQRLVSSV